MKGRIAVIFHRLGPYHHARLRAAGRLLDLTAIELSAADDTYAWAEVEGAEGFRRLTLFHERDVVHEPANWLARKLHAALEETRPDAVAVPGWSDRGALAALAWCQQRSRPAIIMSDSTQSDEPRTWWKEALKRRIVGLCAAGLVGGRPHADYLTALGMPRERIFTGYDVVDNQHFSHGASIARQNEGDVRRRLGLPQRYFLASSRFVQKKNLPRLMNAYHQYCRQAGDSAWHLVILGDGEMRGDLERQREALGLNDRIQLPGFKQYEELPTWYGLAGIFVHASTTEQWGLVVNEAMAASLPVLVSNSCGCASDLVEEAVNGFTFDPSDVEALARIMVRMSVRDDLDAMGRASRRIIASWTPISFAEGLQKAFERSGQIAYYKAKPLDRAILRGLLAYQGS